MAAGATPVGAEALEWQRILLGLPRVGLDTGARELPQETGQEYALHHTKGCYIGQEIVERIHARGVQVHQALDRINRGRRALPARGSKVLAGNVELGETHQQRGDGGGRSGADRGAGDMSGARP